MFGSVDVKQARSSMEDAAFELAAERMLLPDVDAMIDDLAMVKRLADGMIGKLARRIGDTKQAARTLGVPTGEVRAWVEPRRCWRSCRRRRPRCVVVSCRRGRRS